MKVHMDLLKQSIEGCKKNVPCAHYKLIYINVILEE
jgi:hypothetical protein